MNSTRSSQIRKDVVGPLTYRMGLGHVVSLGGTHPGPVDPHDAARETLDPAGGGGGQ